MIDDDGVSKNQNAQRIEADAGRRFRVARRAYPFDVAVVRDEKSITIVGAHDGYRRLPGRPVHRRRWTLTDGRLEVDDSIEGVFRNALARVHFHPVVRESTIGASGALRAGDDVALHWSSAAGVATIAPSLWHPEFGLDVPNLCLALPIEPAGTPATCRFVLEWARCTSSS